MELREYQKRDVDALRAAFRRSRRILYVLPTGGGKTVSFCHIISNAAQRGKRTYVVVHRQELVGQTSDKLYQYGTPHGIVRPGVSASPRELVQVCMVQTLARRLDKLPEPDFLVVDEGHHAAAGTWEKILARWPRAFVLLVTATPERLDGKGLAPFADEMIVGPSVSELIREGYLAKPRVFAPSNLDLEGVHVVRGDYDQAEVAERVRKSQIVGDAVKHYRDICGGKPAIAFCVNIEEAKKTAEQFRAAGFNSVAIDGNTEDWQRKGALKGLATGSVHVVTSCNLISEGFDCPGVYAAILLRPTKSLAMYLQQVGRALRPFPGKENAIILDHVGNVFDHGMPDAPRKWSLEGRKGRRRKDDDEPSVPVKQCPNCYRCHAPAPVCPECGHKYANDKAPKVVDGELKELTVDEQAALMARKSARQEQGRAQTVEDLQRLAAARGYKNPAKWARIIMESRLRKQGAARGQA